MDNKSFIVFIFTGLCRRLKFSTPLDGYALKDHVIKNISLHAGTNVVSGCSNRCTMESRCVSMNIGPPIRNTVTCQLSDSDNIQHSQDLKPLEGFRYRGTEVSGNVHYWSTHIYSNRVSPWPRLSQASGINFGILWHPFMVYKRVACAADETRPG